jgi:hypothetical protein
VAAHAARLDVNQVQVVAALSDGQERLGRGRRGLYDDGLVPGVQQRPDPARSVRVAIDDQQTTLVKIAHTHSVSS